VEQEEEKQTGCLLPSSVGCVCGRRENLGRENTVVANHSCACGQEEEKPRREQTSVIRGRREKTKATKEIKKKERRRRGRGTKKEKFHSHDLLD
jgi:hypothetical protein